MSLWAAFSFQQLVWDCLLGGVLMAVGDFVAQLLDTVGRISRISFKRILLRTLVTTFILGPKTYLWFLLLHVYVEGPTWGHVVMMIVLDQVISAPISTAMTLILFDAVEKGGSIFSHWHNAALLLPTTMRVNYRIWPLVHIVSFGVVHPSHRVAFVSAFGLLWNIVLCTTPKQHPKVAPVKKAIDDRRAALAKRD